MTAAKHDTIEFQKTNTKAIQTIPQKEVESKSRVHEALLETVEAHNDWRVS